MPHSLIFSSDKIGISKQCMPQPVGNAVSPNGTRGVLVADRVGVPRVDLDSLPCSQSNTGPVSHTMGDGIVLWHGQCDVSMQLPHPS